MTRWKRFAQVNYNTLNGPGAWETLCAEERARHVAACEFAGRAALLPRGHQQALQPLFRLWHHHEPDYARRTYAARLAHFDVEVVLGAVERLKGTWSQSRTPPLATVEQACRLVRKGLQPEQAPPSAEELSSSERARSRRLLDAALESLRVRGYDPSNPDERRRRGDRG